MNVPNVTDEPPPIRKGKTTEELDKEFIDSKASFQSQIEDINRLI